MFVLFYCGGFYKILQKAYPSRNKVTPFYSWFLAQEKLLFLIYSWSKWIMIFFISFEQKNILLIIDEEYFWSKENQLITCIPGFFVIEMN